MAKNTNQQSDVGELVRKLEQDYITGETTISKYVSFSQRENIEKIDAYLNSKHTSGERDSLGREKPFFNIVTAAVNIWYRATDIDRKNIRIKADKKQDTVAAYVASLHVQEWMRRNNFGQVLNDWGRSLARYGSSVLKFIEQDGKLKVSVTPWNRLISDTVDFENNPKIELLWFTPAQLLKNKNYDQEIVQKLLEAREARETSEKVKKDNKNDYIQLYEVHGELPKSYLTGKVKDENEYVQQMHVVTFVAGKGKGKFDDFTLYAGKEAKDPYMITHLIQEDGRAMSIGAVENLFEAQWMVNHSVKQIKDHLDLASKLIFQTSDTSFVGQNVLQAIETGDILIHTTNEPLTQINNKADITALQGFGQQWQVLSQDITSTGDAIRGNNQPSGTAWRQVEALRQEAHSLFELMTENKGLECERMMREFIIPHIKKQMDTADELAVTLDSVGLMEFDSMYVPSEVVRRDNKQIKEAVFANMDLEASDPAGIAANIDPNLEAESVKKDLASLGTQRFIKPSDIKKTWKKELENLEWDVSVDVAGEETDKDAVLTTLTTVLQTLATNPMVLQDPNMRLIFNKILEQTGAISTLELAQIPAQPQQPNGGGSTVEPNQPTPQLNANPQPVPA